MTAVLNEKIEPQVAEARHSVGELFVGASMHRTTSSEAHRLQEAIQPSLTGPRGNIFASNTWGQGWTCCNGGGRSPEALAHRLFLK